MKSVACAAMTLERNECPNQCRQPGSAQDRRPRPLRGAESVQAADWILGKHDVEARLVVLLGDDVATLDACKTVGEQRDSFRK